MIDTHTHLYLPEFSEDGDTAAVDRALAAGVRHMVLPNVDASSVGQLAALADKRPDAVSTAWGLHPTEVDERWRETTDGIFANLDRHDCVAVGEIGMDLYWDATHRELQMQAFEYQVGEALRRHLPVIIHCREALDETLEVLSAFNGNMPDMVFHSFTGSAVDVDRIRRICDPWFGINGVVTFKNARDLHSAVPEIGLTRIVLETDSPYLAPVPLRGKRNESSFLPHILCRVAELTATEEKETESITDINAKTLFRLCRS